MAEDTYPNAGRESGYTDEAGRPVGEDLVNKLTILISGVETKLLLQGQETRGAIADLARQQTHADRVIQTVQKDVEGRADYFYTKMGAFLKDADARFQNYDAVLSNVSTTMQEVVSGLGELTGRVERLEIGLARVEVRQDALETQGAPAKAVDEIHLLTKRIGRVEFLVLCLVVAVASNALIFIVAILIGGGR